MSPTTLAPPAIEAPPSERIVIDAGTLKKRAMEILATLKRDKADSARAASADNRRGDALVRATGRSVFDRAIADVERTLDVLDRAAASAPRDATPVVGRVR